MTINKKIRIFDNHSKVINKLLIKLSKVYRKKLSLLDIGCYDGKRTILFRLGKRSLTGIDLHANLKSKYRRQINFFKLDFLNRHFTFKNNNFDIIFSFDTIEHLKQPRLMLRKAYELLSSQGVLILGTPNKYRLFNFLPVILKFKKYPYYFDLTKKNDPALVHETEFSENELISLLKLERFQIKKVHKIFYGIPGGVGIAQFGSPPLYHNLIIEAIKK